jgi:hypothetical protein
MGCSGNSQSTSPTTTSSGAGSAEGRGFVAEEMVRATVKVAAVNTAKRTVTIENAEGRTMGHEDHRWTELGRQLSEIDPNIGIWLFERAAHEWQ